MKKIALITSVDYELFGDGSGNVTREQIDTTSTLLSITNKYGVKLTILFEYAQFRAYNKFGDQNEQLLEDNEKIKNQLIALVKDGHDVQLHYHAQWDEAVYDKIANSFKVNINHVDISSLPYDTIVQRLLEGKEFLEHLLKPYNPDYECIGFRAGSWAVKDQKKVLKALKEAGFKSDTSVVPNTKFESEQINFEYKNCPHQYHYWYIDDILSKATVSSNDFVEIPIYTRKSPLAYFKYLNNKYLVSRKIVSKIYKIKISEKNFSLLQKLKKIITRDYYMADLNTMSYKTLIKMIDDVVKSDEFLDEEIIPIMMICHSKTSYALDDLNLFYNHLKQNRSNDIEFWTYQKAIQHLVNAPKKKMQTQGKIRYIRNEREIDCKLPIVGQEKYLQCKSDEYGWLINNDYAIAFFIDKQAVFKRLVFTTAILSQHKNFSIQPEEEFLNNVIEYVKKFKLCDFIYKAQSNVVFDFCPKGSNCIPWGTYEVDINRSEEELFSSFNGKCRNAIRKALKDGVHIEETNDIDIVYKNIKETLQRQQSVHYPSYNYIESLKKNLKDNVLFLIAKKKTLTQGSLILVYDENRGYAMYAGSIKSPNTGSLDLLHYEAMKYLSTQGIKIYDFVGTRIKIRKGSKQEGIDRFKRKFNPTLKEGCAFRIIVNPKKYFLYSIIAKLYLKLKGYKYIDPISEIKKEYENKNKTLLMGPHYNKKNSQMVGGPIVLFEDLLTQLDKKNFSYIVIDTNKKNYLSPCLAYISIFFQFLYKFPSSTHITLHSSRDYMIFGALVVLVGKMFNKKTSLRKFGGEASKTYKDANFIKKLYLKFIFTNFDNLYMETKYLVSFFLQLNKNTFWFPNVRHKKLEPILPRSFNKKFVFISHVIKEKGINEIIEAARHLDDSYTIDIYGPLLKGHFQEDDFKNKKVTYKGVLEADSVLKKLNEYDVVLLPSYKEGYPGIIIEAYSLGMPVIATSLESIKEIVEVEKTGLLVEPKNVNDLVNAIKFYDKENYKYMSEMAYKKFDKFESDVVSQKFLETALV